MNPGFTTPDENVAIFIAVTKSFDIRYYNLVKPITLLLADDHFIVREGLRACFADQKQIKIVGEASNGKEAIEKAEALRPDVILLDISMPVMSGIEALPILRRRVQNSKIIVLTIHNSKEYVSRILKSGAHGYVLKDAAPAELLRAIESVYGGDAFFSPAVSKTLVSSIQREEAELSKRECEVLSLIAEGYSNVEIAERLFISERTVGTHRERIMKKLDIHSAAGLTKYAIAHGLTGAK